MWKKLAAVTLLSFVFLSSDLALARGSRGGHSSGGSGSSHKGGHYRNTRTNDHYQKRWRGFDVQLSWIHPTLDTYTAPAPLWGITACRERNPSDTYLRSHLARTDPANPAMGSS